MENSTTDLVNLSMSTENQTYFNNGTMNNTNGSYLNQTIFPDYEYGYEYEYYYVLEPEHIIFRRFTHCHRIWNVGKLTNILRHENRIIKRRLPVFLHLNIRPG